MSTGLECFFIEVAPQEWWYVLENMDAPKCAWDWREHATAYGPFKTFELADADLEKYHANPGSYSVIAWEEGAPNVENDAVMKKLMDEAKARPKRRW